MKGQQLVDGPLLPLVLRAVLLVATVLVAFVTLDLNRADPTVVLGPALTLLVVIALGALPLPGPNARLLQSFAEISALGFVIGSIGTLGPSFVPLMLIPAFAAGQRGGLALGAGAATVGGASWVLAVLSAPPSGNGAFPLGDPLLWTFVLVATGLIGGWVRRLTLQTQGAGDGAYADAFRLLSELQELARDLSLGLDPVTLGNALLEEVAQLHPDGRRTLAVSTTEGRLAPLVASGPTAADDATDVDETTLRAWQSGRRESDSHDGLQREAFPVRMGTRVVAVLTVRSTGLTRPDVATVERAVSDAGPRLAAALTFDEVRRLATVDERLRLAREIHDGIAQELASVGYLLDDLAERVPGDAAREVEDVRDHVRRVTGELRLSIFDLRSGVDDEIGLGTALSEHVQRIGQQSDLVVHTVLDEHGPRLPVGVEVELLRVAQEAVTNVRKHAQANNLWVECTVDAPRAWLRIADDGVGLQPAGPQSMGMRGMQERARRIGGDLLVLARPGGGTVVEISIGDWDEETGTP
ncbi:sensor histidine kinase [Aquipuribacter sp. MA13-6]|uniref:sensor histidine kinase n=1 Tax=unclassified Aquipuribacter TaxID=2635084 RepID=UPI003EEBE301